MTGTYITQANYPQKGAIRIPVRIEKFLGHAALLVDLEKESKGVPCLIQAGLSSFEIDLPEERTKS